MNYLDDLAAFAKQGDIAATDTVKAIYRAQLEEKLRQQREADERDALMGRYCESRAFLEGVSFARWQGLEDF